MIVGSSEMVIVIAVFTLVVTSLSHFVYAWTFSNYRKGNLPPHFNISVFKFIAMVLDGSLVSGLYNASRALGPLFYFVGPRNIFAPTIVCGDIELAKIILMGDVENKKPAAEKSGIYKLFNTISFGRPTVFSKLTHGQGWHWARKGVAPSFSMNNLTSTIPTLNVELDKLMAHMQTLSGNQKPVDITSLMIHFTIDFLTLSMFGESLNAFQDYDKPAGCSTLSEGKKFLDELNIATGEYFKIADPFRRYNIWKPEVRRAKQAMKCLDKFTIDLLERYRSSHSEECIRTDSSIMGHLLRSPYPTDDDRRADMITFLLAGHDTTGCALAWTILEVAKHPEVLAKIREELDEVNPDRSIPFDSSHLPKLEYLWNVIRESLRLWPPAIVASNRVADREIKYKDFCIPKGSYIQINSFNMMRTGITRPDEFIPARWEEGGADSQEQKLLLDQFIPFSLGKRNCIGQNMALLELKLVLATLFRRFEFKISSSPSTIGTDTVKKSDVVTAKSNPNSGCWIGDQEYEIYLTIKPKNALLTVHERQ